MFRHILLASDGSELSGRAADAAIGMAHGLGARFSVYTSQAAYSLSPFSEVVVEAPDDFAERCAQAAQRVLNDVVARARRVGLDCTTHTSVCEAPYLGIVETAETEGCDLIVMASQGRHGLGSLLLGSETKRVLSHSRVPVLVYR